jgi:hypothetical protein
MRPPGRRSTLAVDTIVLALVAHTMLLARLTEGAA